MIKNKLKIGIASVVAILFALIALYPGKATVLTMIAGAYIVAPEAARITQHYVFGNGEDLYLNADYIKNSPVILKNLNLKKGEVRRIALKQHEDWRLSYALNPMHIKRNGKGYTVFEYVDYGHGINKDVVSQLNLGFAKVKVHDNIVHSFECTPFTVYFNFDY
jgi:hypothetical protein